MLVEISVATTVTPGTTAPLGSVTTPEIEPVIAAQAVMTPKKTHMLKIKTDLVNRFIDRCLHKIYRAKLRLFFEIRTKQEKTRT